jgi:hypothetical protein
MMAMMAKLVLMVAVVVERGGGGAQEDTTPGSGVSTQATLSWPDTLLAAPQPSPPARARFQQLE